jgi:type IV secretory pathway VirB10-like protein
MAFQAVCLAAIAVVVVSMMITLLCCTGSEPRKQQTASQSPVQTQVVFVTAPELGRQSGDLHLPLSPLPPRHMQERSQHLEPHPHQQPNRHGAPVLDTTLDQSRSQLDETADQMFDALDAAVVAGDYDVNIRINTMAGGDKGGNRGGSAEVSGQIHACGTRSQFESKKCHSMFVVVVVAAAVWVVCEVL